MRTPIPIASECKIVVLTSPEIVEIQVRPSRLGFPCTPTISSGSKEEIGVGDIASKLSSVLAERIEHSVFTGEISSPPSPPRDPREEKGS